MPVFEVTLSDGRTFEVESDAPPSEADVLKALGPQPSAQPEAKSGPNYDMMPTLGGMVGGLGGFLLAGPPGAIAGAGLGGAAGKAAAQHYGPEKPKSAGEALGGMVSAGGTQALAEAIPQGAGRLLTRAAPHAMDMGLKRTAADRLKFPNTPKTLVKEGIIPRGQNVQHALSATEAKIMAEAQAFDAARPRVAGYLPPAREAVPMGPMPTPSGGRPAVSTPERINPHEATLGHYANLVPERLLGNPTRQYLGTPTVEGTADTVSGAGTVLRPMQSAPGRGAPPTMVDPEKIANSAHAFAMGQGKIHGLGSQPGPEVEELNAIARQYLAQNPRPRTLAETINQKRAYQARASYSARPNAPTVTNNQLNFNEGVAAANRREAIRLNPKLEADLAKERDLLGALEAQTNAEAKATPLSTVGTLKTMAGLRNPTIMGGAAIGADRTGRALQSPFSAAAVRAVILTMLGQNDD